MQRIGFIWVIVVLSLLAPRSGIAQVPDQPFFPVKPMILPVAGAPGPATWLFGQAYGNTTGAFNFGTAWYSAGQGLHFGLDFSMPCGTPLVAVADAEVYAVDSLSFGAGPHNLLLRHPQLNLISLYGHLLRRAELVPGQIVLQGDVVGLSGDPDGTCTSRPHLHFEVRASNFRVAYNPVDYIEAPWHSLVTIGPFSNPMFQQDMDNPRRWLSLDDQPAVQFGGARLNDYYRAWPYPIDVRPPNNPTLSTATEPLPATPWRLRQVGFGGCCARPWWHPADANRFYMIDGVPGQRASVFEYHLAGSQPPTIAYEAPPRLQSPDGRYQVTRVNGAVTIRDLNDLREWPVQTQGFLPGVSAGNSALLWEVWKSDYIPGGIPQTVETWVSALDGSNARMVYRQSGGWAVWLDDHRLLINSSVPNTNATTLRVQDTHDGSLFDLGTWEALRGLSVAPGGGRVLFYLAWQADPNANGMYVLETQPGAVPQQVPFFGGWRWRDADSVYYLPFDPSSEAQSLAYYHLVSGEHRYLTDIARMPFTVADGDWSVSPDGNRILFLNARDRNTWLLEAAPAE
ncbi:MAG: M23 family metallopeptidase [Anaerolineae bacterium]|nr:M23 family metallopeptidase [Anaerolineae bacterium]